MTSQIATVGQIAASAGGSSTPSASVIMAEASAGTQHVLKKASSTSNPPQPSSSSPEVRPTPTHHSVLISLTSGAMAGAVAKTVIAPLDRTKIYFQTHPERSYRLKRAFKYIHTTYQTQVRHNLIVHYTVRKRVTSHEVFFFEDFFGDSRLTRRNSELDEDFAELDKNFDELGWKFCWVRTKIWWVRHF